MSTSAINRSMSRSEWAMLVCLSVAIVLFNAVAVHELPVLTIVAARVALAAIILHLVMRMRGQNFLLAAMPPGICRHGLAE
ncbi:MAG: hypothetical protein R3D29_14740 [Nitratireductor sp.]